MASNKKAQILAAVMCASSIFGSYTVVSAADTPTKIESTDKNSSVTANGSTITVKAGATGGQQSTITLGDKSLAINVGKQTTTDGITYGAFSLNSSNVVVNGNRLTMKSSTSSYATDLTNAGLTIKDGKTTVASLNNNGLNIYDGINTKATATITKAGAITGTGLTVKAVSDTIKTEGNYVESKVTTSGVADTIKQGGFTRATSNVTTNSIKDTIYTDSGTELSSINVFKNTAANGIENGKVSLTAKKIVTDNQTSTTTTSTLTLGGDNASLKVGNYGFTVDSNNNVLFSGKNASLTSTGLTVNGTGTSSIKSTNATTEAYTKNDISSAGMTTTARGGKYPSDNDNKTTSAVTYTGVTDTVYDDGGNLKTKSSVTTSGITNTVYDVNTGNALANSSLTTSGISNTTTDLAMTGANAGNTMSTTLNQNSAGITASATKKAEDGSTIGTSTLTLGGNSASLKVGNYGFAVDNNNNVSINGKNASLSGSTFTLKDIASGKNVASLSTRGLSIYNADGTSVGGISNTGAVSGKSLSITAENADGNKTISTVSATGVTDTVYGTDETTKVAYSSVGTGGISNTTSLKTDTGKIDTAINQNKSGVSISSTAYSGQNLRSGNSSVSVNGAKTTISSSGGYEYSSDGEVLKYNTASLSLDGNAGTVGLSGKNVSLTNTDLTLKNVETGKAYVKIGSNGLNIYNDEGTSVFGVTRTGAINIDKNVTIDDSYTKDGYTYTASNSISGSNGIRNVATKKDESGKTIATSSSTVTTSGITNSTNISGIAIKDDKNNTKTMNTSIAQNANGVSISSTKYNVYSDGTNTIQTTDGTSSISVNGAKTTISGYGNYEYERDESGKLVVSSRNSASLSVDGESGIISLSGKNVGLNANGLTLYKDVEGVKTQYASLSAGGLSVNGTSTTTIKSTNATTGAMGQSQVSYNGVTDTVTNAAGNKTTSTVSATGVTDRVYGTDGTTQVASSSVSTSGISNTTTNLQMTGANAGNTMSTTLNQNSAGITASATKKAEDGSTIGTSTLTLGGNSASLKVGNYGFAVDNNNNVSINGKNASLSGSTFTLKDIASGKNVASLSTRGLSIYNADGTSVGGISNTGAVSGKSLSITAENADGNKTISTVSATGVTDTVYGTDETTKVAYSSVGTGGISNTTSLKTDTGKIDTAINQNKSGVSISSTAYSGQNLRSGNSSVSVNGAKTTISSSGGYEYSSDGEVLKYNTASLSLDGNAGTVGLSGKNVSLTNTDLTLKNVETGKAYVKIGSNGLNIYNDEGTSVFGVTRTGAINIDKNVTIDDSYTKDGYTYTASNSISGSNGIRNVATKKDESGKTIATSSSTVTTSGITNSTNISGIAIKDDKNNTKTMNTSIAQNANGVSISSTKYNVYSDGTNTIQTTDGTSSISVNGAKTTISGYGNYEYERDESGKLVVSSRNSASLSVDGESGIISLSGKNVGLNANGLTLYKDVEGVKTQYASLSAGGLSVNGTSTTTIKSTNATTGAMGQSQVSYNGVTDTVTNAAGNKTTSTVSATGTTDQVYDTDGKTRIAYSNVTTNGITDSFTKDGVTNSVTTNANGTTFASTGNGTTTIKGGSITTNSITVAGNTIDGGFFDTIGETNSNTAGIVRTEINGDWITSIEGAINISRSGNISLNADKLTYSYNDGKNSGTLGALANKVDDIYDRTQGIDYDKATGTTTIDGNLSVKDETTTGGTAGSTGETGTTPINGNITANTANIGGVQMGNNTVTATTGNFENITVGGTEGTSINKDGVTVGDKKSDNYTSITNNDVVVNNNGNKTSLADVGNRVTGLESSVNSMNNRLSDVEDRIDKVGAMSAAIANLRTMGFDPEAPTEIAIGVGQYKSETGLALGVFHYPNQDFMLSASISTSGDEVMGGIGATWKLGRKSAAEKAKDEEARRLEKAEEMKKLAQDAKVKAQAERHAKLLAEREAQKTA